MGKSSRHLRASSFGVVLTATLSSYRGAAELLGDAGFERRLQRLAHRLELDAVEDLLVEAAHDQALGLAAGETAGHAVEELVAINMAARRCMRAGHSVDR